MLYYGNIVTDGLVFFVDAAKKDSYSGTGTSWKDVTNGRQVGTLTNGPTFDSSNGGSIVFDGNNDYVLFPKQSYLSNISRFSISAWMKRNLSNSLVIIGQIESLSNDISFELWNDGNAYFEVGNGANSYGFVSNTSTNWQHLTMVFDGSQSTNATRLKAYVNGSSVTLSFTGTIPATTGTINTNLNVGAYLPNINYSNGNISQISIYNKSLSDVEVLRNYNATKGRYGL